MALVTTVQLRDDKAIRKALAKISLAPSTQNSSHNLAAEISEKFRDIPLGSIHQGTINENIVKIVARKGQNG